jgi:hypothetical protein
MNDSVESFADHDSGALAGFVSNSGIPLPSAIRQNNVSAP